MSNFQTPQGYIQVHTKYIHFTYSALNTIMYEMGDRGTHEYMMDSMQNWKRYASGWCWLGVPVGTQARQPLIDISAYLSDSINSLSNIHLPIFLNHYHPLLVNFL